MGRRWGGVLELGFYKELRWAPERKSLGTTTIPFEYIQNSNQQQSSFNFVNIPSH